MEFEENKEGERELNDVTSDGEDDKGMRMILAVSAVMIIAAGFVLGRFVLPLTQSSIDARTQAMLKTDSSYLAAEAESSALNAEIASFIQDSERIENTFNDVVEYQKQYDELSRELDGLKSSLETARSALSSAQTKFTNTEVALNQLRSRTVTLSPGTYTVGTHIPAGTYLVRGNGSLLAAGTDRTLKININLDKIAPYQCELAENDTIKLSSAAEFEPEVGNGE